MKSVDIAPEAVVTRRPREGAWIEMWSPVARANVHKVAPVRGRGLKSPQEPQVMILWQVAPVWGRGLKWLMKAIFKRPLTVALVRGRGLKLVKVTKYTGYVGRPRMGAWIEISPSSREVSGPEKSPPYGGVE